MQDEITGTGGGAPAAPAKPKRRKGVNVTGRSVDLLRRQGYGLVEVVERWNAFARVKNDLFGIVDVIACGDAEVLGVQVTSRSNMSARRQKIAEHPSTPIVRQAGIRLEIHGWDKGPDGKWRVKIEDIS